MSWMAQAFFEARTIQSEHEMHQQELKPDDFRDEFLSSTLENWQSEFLQLASFVILATYFIHKDSPQSRDGDDEMKKLIQEIHHKVLATSTATKKTSKRKR
jgi:hypothetical protein